MEEENYAKEAHFDYLDRKIEYEKEKLNKAEKRTILIGKHSKLTCLLCL